MFTLVLRDRLMLHTAAHQETNLVGLLTRLAESQCKYSLLFTTRGQRGLYGMVVRSQGDARDRVDVQAGTHATED